MRRGALRAGLVIAVLLAAACASTPSEPLPPSLDISASAHPYFETVRRQIRPHWAYPCVTGSAVYDESALTAIRRAAPFPPVPPDVLGQWRKRDGNLPLNMNVNDVVQRRPEHLK